MEIREPGAHIDHMLRQTRMHNMQLSTMADMKASMLLTVSSLVFGLCLTHLSSVPRDPVFVILAVASVVTIALAIYATMPRAGPSPLLKTQLDPKSPKFTLLFFGDYANLSYDEFEKEMEGMMASPSRNYEAQVRELYNLGCYLARHKFQKLRLAYVAFLIGTIAAAGVAAFRYLE